MKLTRKQISAVRKNLGLQPAVQRHIPGLYRQQLTAGWQSTQHVRNERPNNAVIEELLKICFSGFTTRELQDAFCDCGLRPPTDATVNVEMNNIVYCKINKKWFSRFDGNECAILKFVKFTSKFRNRYILITEERTNKTLRLYVG